MREQAFWERVKRDGQDGCWEWQGWRIPTGYGRTKGGMAHRIAFTLSKGPIPPGMYVCHSCDNPPCCNPSHLWLGSQAENIADMRRKGRGYSPPKGTKTGCKNPAAKITDRDAVEIRRLRGTVSGAELARRYGLKRSTVSLIQNRKLWKHV